VGSGTMIVGTGALLSHGGVGGGVTSGTVEVVVAVIEGLTMPVVSKVSCGPVSGGSGLWPPSLQATSTSSTRGASLRRFMGS
jgi:hypothetical protein